MRWAICTARPMPPVSPCAPWLWSGISTPTGLARAATTRRGARRSTTSMASSITPTGSTTSSSPPPWEGENYEPRNPMQSDMPYVNVHGVNLFYEEYGEGPVVLLTPGGRVDRNGLCPIAALLSPRCRVILHDRRNCGRSDVVIGGELSEQHLWAEEMAGLLVQISAAPAYAAGGSAGSRTSLPLAVRHPELVKGVFIWE